MSKKRVLLGMSGGVDSSMSAWYLQQQGFEVVGITFNTLSPITTEESLHFIHEAKKLAQSLNFEHHTLDVYSDFKKEVIDYFVNEYLAGKTPNPCIRCNETIKWKLLFEQSESLNCDYISTGHYVSTIEEDGVYYIKKGIDSSKDQSYFLWNLPQNILKKCIFPLGNKPKAQVKEKANELGFKSMATKKESMGVCFLQGSDYRDFINNWRPEIKSRLANGSILNKQGEVIGSHDGFPYYTIGQKRGLNLTSNQGECVAEILPEANQLVTAPKNTLYSNHLQISDYMMNHPDFLSEKQQVYIRIRGLDCVPPTPGTIFLENKLLQVNFSEPVWAITPGQSVVFYQEDRVVGGGIVDKV